MNGRRSLVIGLVGAVFLTAAAGAGQSERPNFLWIIAEDMSPLLGSYGNDQVDTPHLDALAARSVRFTRVWAGGPACSPSRSSLFTGLYALTLGTETHREARSIPEWAFWPQYLKAAGYHTTNNAKRDYNAKKMGKDWWDASSRQATYLDRPAGKPFFHCYSSLMETHLSCLIKDQPEDRVGRHTVDPADVALPEWLPDLPELRDDRAWHFRAIGLMDERVGQLLAELDASGEAANTIVFFFSDHGGCLPGAKGFAWDHGFRVPFIAYFPPRWEHLAPPETTRGGTSDALISFLDFGPTLLSLAGVEAPAYLQGQAFAGPARASTPRDALLGFRGINGGRWDAVRALRDERFLYVRNFLPHRPSGQRQNYQWQVAGQQAWERAFRRGELSALEARFWRARPAEELYDLVADPEQNRDLANHPAHAELLAAKREQLRKVLHDIGDHAVVPNTLRQPQAYPSFYDRMSANPEAARLVREAAWRASMVDRVDDLAALAQAEDPAVRYWATVGLTGLAGRGREPEAIRRLARQLLNDPAPEVRVGAAEALMTTGETAAGLPVLIAEITGRGRAQREALAAVEALGPAAIGVLPALQEAARKHPEDFFLRSARIALGDLDYNDLYRGPTDTR